MSKVIICSNQKGGTGKSTCTINLGIGLARKGKRVCIIDNDAQASCTAALGFREPDEMKVTLSTMFEKILNKDPINPKEGILHHPEGVDLMPSNIELTGVEQSLVGISGSETILREYVDILRPYYDYIIIDTCPGLGQLTLNALVCADSVIIPVESAYLSSRGLEALLKTISKVKRKLNPDLTIEGIVITKVDRRTKNAKEIEEIVREAYGDKLHIFHNIIPKSVRVEETSAYGISVYKHDPKGKATKAYEALTEEVLVNE